jgi:hypothetical protein
VDFIDEAIEKHKTRLTAGKGKPLDHQESAQKEEIEKLARENRQKVDHCIANVVFPLVVKVKKIFDHNGFKAEADLDTSASIDLAETYSKGAKLQLHKRIDRKTGVPLVTGPSLSFSASPPYSTTISIMAYGEDNKALFSERWELTEMTEALVVDCLKRFVQEIIR